MNYAVNGAEAYQGFFGASIAYSIPGTLFAQSELRKKEPGPFYCMAKCNHENGVDSWVKKTAVVSTPVCYREFGGESE